MQNKIVKIGNIDVANDKPFVLFGGMNVLESVIWRCKCAKLRESDRKTWRALCIQSVF